MSNISGTPLELEDRPLHTETCQQPFLGAEIRRRALCTDFVHPTAPDLFCFCGHCYSPKWGEIGSWAAGNCRI